MPRKEILDRIGKYIEPFRITDGERFRLKDIDPGDTCGLRMDKGEAADLLQRGTEWLAEEQQMLYAQDRWSVLLVFQALDAAGKDGTIRHVMSGVNPQGCQVFSFKQPSKEDLDHDFMWRYIKCLPERGRIGIFNRSSLVALTAAARSAKSWPFERPATATLAASRFTSHSQGPGKVSSKSLTSSTCRRSGEANAPKFPRCASPHSWTRNPDCGVAAKSAAMIAAAPR